MGAGAWVRASLCLEEGARLVLMLADAAGEQRIRLSVTGTGRPFVELRDANGEPRLSLSLAPDGQSVIPPAVGLPGQKPLRSRRRRR